MLKPQYILHVLAVITIMLGAYIFFGKSENVPQVPNAKHKTSIENTDNQQKHRDVIISLPLAKFEEMISDQQVPVVEDSRKNINQDTVDINSDQLVTDYIAAWNNRDKTQIDKLWSIISKCDSCLQEFVELAVAKKFERGLLLEVAIKMAALDSDTVLPVFDALIRPDGDKNTAIILSEKLVTNGRPEFVAKIFDVIYRAKESGYENFSRQLTWVISKLENPRGIEPILDTITGRKPTSPENAAHISSVYSKVVRSMQDSSKAATIIANYYQQSNSAEQQKLWPVVSQHGNTLVALAVDANKNGQNYDVQKFAEAMTQLPHLNAVNSLMQLHTSIEYSPNYMRDMLSKRVADNPTIKVLHKLEDYMRNPAVKLESRLFAAEGLLAVRQNRQARYILQKVIDNTQDPDVELQAYIGGRL